MARVMLHAKSLPLYFLAEALNTACHIYKRISLRPGTLLMNYQLWKGRKPNVKYFQIFNSTCYILMDKEFRHKWDSKSNKAI